MLRQEGPQARQALSALLAGRLIFMPRAETRQRYYEFAGLGMLGNVIPGVSLPNGIGAPEGDRPG